MHPARYDSLTKEVTFSPWQYADQHMGVPVRELWDDSYDYPTGVPEWEAWDHTSSETG